MNKLRNFFKSIRRPKVATTNMVTIGAPIAPEVIIKTSANRSCQFCSYVGPQKTYKLIIINTKIKKYMCPSCKRVQQ